MSENVKDPLKWWWEHRRTYPTLSHMALDYLSIPCEYFDPHFNCRLTDCMATSVDVECAFSGGRWLLSFTRNRLSAESIRRLMCLGSWYKNNLVSTNILFKAITACSKRPAKAEEPMEAEEVQG
jgi:hypothetical protein